ncbi:MAG: mechanosensitive ion channel family protein [Chitinivibrionia bacterium]|nr:mechanosensitive ion channel family protein [Chitinivibrionia bacterium]
MDVRKIGFCVLLFVSSLFAQEQDDVIDLSTIIKGIQTEGVSFLEEIIATGSVIAVVIFLIFILNLLFRRINSFLASYSENHFKSLVIKKYKILDQKQILHTLFFLTHSVKWVLFILLLIFTIPVIFGIFPQTRDFATTIWGYFLSPVRKIVFGIIGYIPQLITIVVILFFVRYILKTLKFFSSEIEKERLVIKGFYPEWAKPTYFLLKYTIYAFTIALVFPYLPNSDTRVFQGVSVFIGLIISIGSSSAIGNLVAGIVITYMRPFHINDRIKIGESEGFVVEKNAFVVRIITDKKEYITFPNITILTSNITNFSHSKESGNGLIVHTNLTVNYSIDWRKIHELLIAAAKKTQFIEQTPEPFVLQKALDDFYCVYEINAYTKEIAEVPKVYSELHKNIQDIFREAGIDLTSPHYEIDVLEKKKAEEEKNV